MNWANSFGMQPTPMTLWPWPFRSSQRAFAKPLAISSPYLGGVTGSNSPVNTSTGRSPLSGVLKSAGLSPFGQASHIAPRPSTMRLPSTVSASSARTTMLPASSVQITDICMPIDIDSAMSPCIIFASAIRLA